MKSKKIISALSALVMGATMMAGTAMSASAYCIHDGNGNCVEDVLFYANFGGNWSPAPYGMDDGNIVDAINNGDGTYTLVLGTGTFTITANGQTYEIQGNIDSISATPGGSNLIDDDTVLLQPNTTYYIYVSAMGAWMPVQLRTNPCSCQNCNC